MTDKIIKLVTSTREANQQTVDILTGLLEQAKSGEIVGFAYAAVLPDGSSQTQCTFTDNFQQLLGAMCILEFRMLSEARVSK